MVVYGHRAQDQALCRQDVVHDRQAIDDLIGTATEFRAQDCRFAGTADGVIHRDGARRRLFGGSGTCG
ncbi:hypothetical protein GCM10010404_93060 [Nonomuraea africana]